MCHHDISYLKRYTISAVFRESKVLGSHPREQYECQFDIVTPNPGRSALWGYGALFKISKYGQHFSHNWQMWAGKCELPLPLSSFIYIFMLVSVCQQQHLWWVRLMGFIVWYLIKYRYMSATWFQTICVCSSSHGNTQFHFCSILYTWQLTSSN